MCDGQVCSGLFFQSLMKAARISSMRKWSFILLALGTFSISVKALDISDAQALEIGRRIWKNECAGTINGLTSWNQGEDFASLGIGHFIWYPAGKKGPFEESFPRLMRYLKEQGKPVGDWMLGPCPWSTRAEFLAAFQSPRAVELRRLLAATVAEQARFASQRLEGALPKMLEAARPIVRGRIRTNFSRIAAEPLGYYALVDYVNFKGEGVNSTERYKGKGWGLLQALEIMGNGPALPAFSAAADQVLTQRTKNAPPSRNESQWLPGWRNRLRTYLK